MNAFHRSGWVSTQITALVLQYKRLAELVTTMARLDVTQYRVLLKSSQLAPSPRIGEIANALTLRQSLVTQAIDRLEEFDLVRRAPDPNDGRGTIVIITEKGESCINKLDAAIAEAYYALWAPLSKDQIDTVIEVGRIIGSGIEGAGLDQGSSRIPSAYVSTIVAAYKGASDTLNDAANASLTEFRTLQQVHEGGDRSRVSHVASELLLPPNTVTQAANRLETRGWLTRTADPSEPRAVYLETTDEGRRLLGVMQSAMDAFLEWRLWRLLDDDQRELTYESSRMLVEAARKRESTTKQRERNERWHLRRQKGERPA